MELPLQVVSVVPSALERALQHVSSLGYVAGLTRRLYPATAPPRKQPSYSEEEEQNAWDALAVDALPLQDDGVETSSASMPPLWRRTSAAHVLPRSTFGSMLYRASVLKDASLTAAVTDALTSPEHLASVNTLLQLTQTALLAAVDEPFMAPVRTFAGTHATPVIFQRRDASCHVAPGLGILCVDPTAALTRLQELEATVETAAQLVNAGMFLEAREVCNEMVRWWQKLEPYGAVTQSSAVVDDDGSRVFGMEGLPPLCLWPIMQHAALVGDDMRLTSLSPLPACIDASRLLLFDASFAAASSCAAEDVHTAAHAAQPDSSVYWRSRSNEAETWWQCALNIPEASQPADRSQPPLSELILVPVPGLRAAEYAAIICTAPTPDATQSADLQIVASTVTKWDDGRTALRLAFVSDSGTAPAVPLTGPRPTTYIVRVAMRGHSPWVTTTRACTRVCDGASQRVSGLARAHALAAVIPVASAAASNARISVGDSLLSALSNTTALTQAALEFLPSPSEAGDAARAVIAIRRVLTALQVRLDVSAGTQLHPLGVDDLHATDVAALTPPERVYCERTYAYAATAMHTTRSVLDAVQHPLVAALTSADGSVPSSSSRRVDAPASAYLPARFSHVLAVNVRLDTPGAVCTSTSKHALACLDIPMSRESGTYAWCFRLASDRNGQETTCFGISRAASTSISDLNYETSRDMYMLRAYNGKLYARGTRVDNVKVDKIHPGSVVYVIYDSNIGALAYCVDGDWKGVVFQGMHALHEGDGLVYPAVAFYASGRSVEVAGPVTHVSASLLTQESARLQAAFGGGAACAHALASALPETHASPLARAILCAAVRAAAPTVFPLHFSYSEDGNTSPSMFRSDSAPAGASAAPVSATYTRASTNAATEGGGAAARRLPPIGAPTLPPQPAPARWACERCTLYNTSTLAACGACGYPRGAAAAVPTTTWKCSICTLVNDIELKRCDACGTERPPSPAASPAPSPPPSRTISVDSVCTASLRADVRSSGDVMRSAVTGAYRSTPVLDSQLQTFSNDYVMNLCACTTAWQRVVSVELSARNDACSSSATVSGPGARLRKMGNSSRNTLMACCRFDAWMPPPNLPFSMSLAAGASSATFPLLKDVLRAAGQPTCSSDQASFAFSSLHPIWRLLMLHVCGVRLLRLDGCPVLAALIERDVPVPVPALAMMSAMMQHPDTAFNAISTSENDWLGAPVTVEQAMFMALPSTKYRRASVLLRLLQHEPCDAAAMQALLHIIPDFLLQSGTNSSEPSPPFCGYSLPLSSIPQLAAACLHLHMTALEQALQPTASARETSAQRLQVAAATADLYATLFIITVSACSSGVDDALLSLCRAGVRLCVLCSTADTTSTLGVLQASFMPHISSFLIMTAARVFGSDRATRCGGDDAATAIPHFVSLASTACILRKYLMTESISLLAATACMHSRTAAPEAIADAFAGAGALPSFVPVRRTDSFVHALNSCMMTIELIAGAFVAQRVGTYIVALTTSLPPPFDERYALSWVLHHLGAAGTAQQQLSSTWLQRLGCTSHAHDALQRACNVGLQRASLVIDEATVVHAGCLSLLDTASSTPPPSTAEASTVTGADVCALLDCVFDTTSSFRVRPEAAALMDMLHAKCKLSALQRRKLQHGDRELRALFLCVLAHHTGLASELLQLLSACTATAAGDVLEPSGGLGVIWRRVLDARELMRSDAPVVIAPSTPATPLVSSSASTLDVESPAAVDHTGAEGYSPPPRAEFMRRAALLLQLFPAVSAAEAICGDAPSVALIGSYCDDFMRHGLGDGVHLGAVEQIAALRGAAATLLTAVCGILSTAAAASPCMTMAVFERVRAALTADVPGPCRPPASVSASPRAAASASSASAADAATPPARASSSRMSVSAMRSPATPATPILAADAAAADSIASARQTSGRDCAPWLICDLAAGAPWHDAHALSRTLSSLQRLLQARARESWNLTDASTRLYTMPSLLCSVVSTDADVDAPLLALEHGCDTTSTVLSLHGAASTFMFTELQKLSMALLHVQCVMWACSAHADSNNVPHRYALAACRSASIALRAHATLIDCADGRAPLAEVLASHVATVAVTLVQLSTAGTIGLCRSRPATAIDMWRHSDAVRAIADLMVLAITAAPAPVLASLAALWVHVNKHSGLPFWRACDLAVGGAVQDGHNSREVSSALPPGTLFQQHLLRAAMSPTSCASALLHPRSSVLHNWWRMCIRACDAAQRMDWLRSGASGPAALHLASALVGFSPCLYPGAHVCVADELQCSQAASSLQHGDRTRSLLSRWLLGAEDNAIVVHAPLGGMRMLMVKYGVPNSSPAATEGAQDAHIRRRPWQPLHRLSSLPELEDAAVDSRIASGAPPWMTQDLLTTVAAGVEAYRTERDPFVIAWTDAIRMTVHRLVLSLHARGDAVIPHSVLVTLMLPLLATGSRANSLNRLVSFADASAALHVVAGVAFLEQRGFHLQPIDADADGTAVAVEKLPPHLRARYELVQQLTAMGYDAPLCWKALELNDDSISRAIDWLLSDHARTFIAGGGLADDEADPAAANRWRRAKELAVVLGLPPKLCKQALLICHDDGNIATNWLLENGRLHDAAHSGVGTATVPPAVVRADGSVMDHIQRTASLMQELQSVPGAAASVATGGVSSASMPLEAAADTVNRMSAARALPAFFSLRPVSSTRHALHDYNNCIVFLSDAPASAQTDATDAKYACSRLAVLVGIHPDGSLAVQYMDGHNDVSLTCVNVAPSSISVLHAAPDRRADALAVGAIECISFFMARNAALFCALYSKLVMQHACADASLFRALLHTCKLSVAHAQHALSLNASVGPLAADDSDGRDAAMERLHAALVSSVLTDIMRHDTAGMALGQLMPECATHIRDASILAASSEQCIRVESLHPQPLNCKYEDTALIPGAKAVYLLFDRRCEMGPGSSLSIFAGDGDSSTSGYRYTSNTTQPWPPLVITSGRVRFMYEDTAAGRLLSSASGSRTWGYSVTLMPLRSLIWTQEKDVLEGACLSWACWLLTQMLNEERPPVGGGDEDSSPVDIPVPGGFLRSVSAADGSGTPATGAVLTRSSSVSASHAAAATGESSRLSFTRALRNVFSPPRTSTTGASSSGSSRSSVLDAPSAAPSSSQTVQGAAIIQALIDYLRTPAMPLKDPMVVGLLTRVLRSRGAMTRGLSWEPFAAVDALVFARCMEDMSRGILFPPKSLQRMVEMLIAARAALRAGDGLDAKAFDASADVTTSRSWFIKKAKLRDPVKKAPLQLLSDMHPADMLLDAVNMAQAFHARARQQDHVLCHAVWSVHERLDDRNLMSCVLHASSWSVQQDVELLAAAAHTARVRGCSLLELRPADVAARSGLEDMFGASSSAVDAARYRFALVQHFNKLLYRCIGLVDITSLDLDGITGALRSASHLIFAETKHHVVETAVEVTWSSGASGMSCTLDNALAFQSLDAQISDPQLSSCVFMQMFRQVGAKSARHFRCRLDDKGRLIYVRFWGEEGLDWGGLYRDALQRSVDDVFSGALDLFIPCSGVRDCPEADKWLPNPKYAVSGGRIMSMYEFVGKLLGVSLRQKAFLPFMLPRLVWAFLTTGDISRDQLEHLDPASVEVLRSAHAGTQVEVRGFTGSRLGDVSGGGTGAVMTYVSMRASELQRQLVAMRRGLIGVVPERAVMMCSPADLELLVCGEADVDVDILRMHTSYQGFARSDRVVKWFWSALRDFTPDERSKFIRFAWGRSRLPRGSQWERPFKLTRRSGGDDQLPVAHSCFFQVDMPAYSSEDILRKRVRAAVHFGLDAYLIL